MLDISAAFDTVDHVLLIARLSNRFGSKGQALKWFESYLHDRKQFVIIDNVKSNNKLLQCGIPQGCGPILYLLYTAPIGDIIRRHSLQYHLYTDDTNFTHTLIKPTESDKQTCMTHIEACITEIRSWLARNMKL